MHTWLGDYQASFMTAGALCLLAAGMVIRIGRESRGELLAPQPTGLPAAELV
jgi:hypothetical protein